MRYLMMLKMTPENAVQPTPGLYADIGKLTEEAMKSGKLVDTGAVQASESGVTLTLTAGKVTAAEGSLSGPQELNGGYAIVEVESKEEAVALARQFLEIHAKHLGPSYTAQSEVRRMYRQADFAQGGAQ